MKPDELRRMFHNNQAFVNHALLTLEGADRAMALEMDVVHYRSKKAADEWLADVLTKLADGPDAINQKALSQASLIHKRMLGDSTLNPKKDSVS
jgi:hypothetical protein